MKLYTRLAVFIICATVIPILLFESVSNGRIDFNVYCIFLGIMAVLILLDEYRTIISPISELKKAIKEIKNGNLDYTLDIDRNDEIGELSMDFEEMRIKLRDLRDTNLNNDNAFKELISNVAHDLKTPITTIRGYAEGILDGVASTPEMQEKYLKTICNKANEMTALIEELTYYTKIDTNRIPYNYSKLNIKNYFDDCADDISMDMEAKNIEFVYSCSVDPDTLVIADPEQIRKVINNIVGNSVKYMTGSVKRITMDISDNGDFIQCSINDTGKGVDKKDLANIFERFYRTDASRNSSMGGSGIGLSIVKKIIEDHGGQIWAGSEEGSGLTINFILRKYFEVNTDG